MTSNNSISIDQVFVIYNFILTHFITTKNKAKYINYKFKITIITIF